MLSSSSRTSVSATHRSLPTESTGESAEQLFEVSDDFLLDVEERHILGVFSQLAREARHPVLLYAARRDPVEPREVGLYVECEAVRRDAPAGKLNTDGSDQIGRASCRERV